MGLLLVDSSNDFLTFLASEGALIMGTWGRLLASGEPGEEAARLRRCDGAYRWFLFRAVPVRDAQGKVVRWYGTNTDIENLKRAASLLAAENARWR